MRGAFTYITMFSGVCPLQGMADGRRDNNKITDLGLISIYGNDEPPKN